jgi:hypothetical protein
MRFLGWHQIMILENKAEVNMCFATGLRLCWCGVLSVVRMFQ